MVFTIQSSNILAFIKNMHYNQKNGFIILSLIVIKISVFVNNNMKLTML